MKRWFVVGATLVVLLAFALAVFYYAQQPGPPPATFKLSGKVDNITLRDLKGQSHSLMDLGRGSKATVVLFIATQCPISNDYNERMAVLDREYSPKGVKFIAINSNRQESVSEVAEHAAKNGFGFAVYKDENNVIADLFGAAYTPEAFVLDSTWTIRYHGRIDDSRQVSKVTASDLRKALDAMLEGKPVPVAETKAFGCTIKRVKKA